MLFGVLGLYSIVMDSCHCEIFPPDMKFDNQTDSGEWEHWKRGGLD